MELWFANVNVRGFQLVSCIETFSVYWMSVFCLQETRFPIRNYEGILSSGFNLYSEYFDGRSIGDFNW